MRVEWVEVLSYELEKNVAFGRSRREGISSDETVKDFQRNAIWMGRPALRAWTRAWRVGIWRKQIGSDLALNVRFKAMIWF